MKNKTGLEQMVDWLEADNIKMAYLKGSWACNTLELARSLLKEERESRQSLVEKRRK